MGEIIHFLVEEEKRREGFTQFPLLLELSLHDAFFLLFSFFFHFG